MKRKWWWTVGVVVVGLLSILAAYIYVLPKDPIPGSVRQQLLSTLLVPKGGLAGIDRGSVKYDKASTLLSFNVAYAGTTIVISEQPTPEQFVDIPAAYDKVVESMGTYQSFEVNVGKVHLARPPQLHGKQAAVLNTKGTLLFAKPESPLADGQWRQFFNHFDIAK